MKYRRYAAALSLPALNGGDSRAIWLRKTTVFLVLVLVAVLITLMVTYERARDLQVAQVASEKLAAILRKQSGETLYQQALRQEKMGESAVRSAPQPSH